MEACALQHLGKAMANLGMNPGLDKPNLLSTIGYLEPIKPCKQEAADFSDDEEDPTRTLGVSGVFGGVEAFHNGLALPNRNTCS